MEHEKHLERLIDLAVSIDRKATAEHYLKIMRDAVKEARAKEREACLAIVETHPTVREMSVAIRSRGNDE